MTVPEVADVLRVSRATVERRIRTGDLPCVRIGHGPKAPVRIEAETVESYVHKARTPEAA